MGQKSLSKYLRDNAEKGIIDHAVRCQMEGEQVTFYIHPQGRDGDTLDFKIFGNTLTAKFEQE